MSNYKAIKVNGKKIDEHRYVMEQHLGRKLARDEVVHHKDGDKTNNAIENLELMSLSEHSRQHMIGHVQSEETRRKISDMLSGCKSIHRKFSDDQVDQIRQLHNEGMTNTKIAKMFNVHHKTISDIINGKNYKN